MIKTCVHYELYSSLKDLVMPHLETSFPILVHTFSSSAGHMGASYFRQAVKNKTLTLPGKRTQISWQKISSVPMKIYMGILLLNCLESTLKLHDKKSRISKFYFKTKYFKNVLSGTWTYLCRELAIRTEVFMLFLSNSRKQDSYDR